ncbi:MAG: N-acetylglucosamine kinase [Streptosporangiales bacterium]
MSVDLAVDGGQSGLRIAVASTPVGTPVAAPGFSWGAGIDPVAVQADAVVSAWQQLGSPGPVGTIACGLSGGPSPGDEAHRLGREVAERTGARRVLVTGDGVTTHAGALGGEAGVVLAAGTGVVCTAIDAAGLWLHVDAWGYLFGDAGGGSWLGQRGLRAAMAASEGRAAPTVLTGMAATRFGELRAFVRRVLAAPTLVAEVASFARDVLAAAADGDETAAALCARAADQLADTACVTVRRGFPGAGAGEVPFTWTGSILLATETVRTRFLKLLAERCPEAGPRAPLGAGIDGAALLATTTGTAHHAVTTEYAAAP